MRITTSFCPADSRLQGSTKPDLMKSKKRSDSTCTARSSRSASTRAVVLFPAPGGPVRIRTEGGGGSWGRIAALKLPTPYDPWLGGLAQERARLGASRDRLRRAPHAVPRLGAGVVPLAPGC